MPILGIIASGISGNLWSPGKDYDSIATTTVGAGGAASIDFTSIPSTYKHLQIRGIARGTIASGNYTVATYMRFNSDTATNYSSHYLQGYTGVGTGVASGAMTSSDAIRIGGVPRDNWTASVFGATVIDILDYTNTSIYKTSRALIGSEGNSTSVYEYVEFTSGSWRSTSAVSSIRLLPVSNSFAQYTQFALYGVK